MPLPNMGNVLTRFEQSVKLKKTTQSIVDHRPVETTAETTINAVIQVAEKEKLQIAIVDWSLQYLMVHSKTSFTINDLIEYKGKDYKIIDLGNWSDYGYYESVAEEVK